MIIPSKFNGFHEGVRRCFGGGGGGGGGDGGGGDGNVFGTVSPFAPKLANAVNASNTQAAAPTQGNMAVNTPQGYNTLAAMKGTPWAQSGSAYNELLNQGFTSDQIKSSAGAMYGQPSDANWGMMVQNAAMTSPTGRPMAGSDQFFQPVYRSSYQNYARPATQFDTSTYGTQPVNSPALAWNLANGGAGRADINNAVNNWERQNQGADINTSLAAMRASGINRTDVQAAGGYNNYAPQTYNPYAQTPYNPYTGGYGMGSGFLGSNQGYGSGYMPQASFMPQMQNPYMQQPSYGYAPQQSMYTPNPFISQQPFGQTAAPNVSSGPANPIVSRSSMARGTPNVMRRAEGGIIALMGKK